MVSTGEVRKRTKLQKNARILIILGLLLTSVGVVRLWQNTAPTIGEASPPGTRVITEDLDEPDELKPVAIEEYVVPADQPRRILIPKLSIDGYIQKVGTTSDDSVAVPTNIHYAGWYTDSVLPGQEGLSIIDGHVSGRYSAAIFERLNELQPGDTFEVEFGDLSKTQFEVITNSQLPESESAAHLFKRDGEIESQLNLITCGGNYDRESESFRDRVIITSKKI